MACHTPACLPLHLFGHAIALIPRDSCGVSTTVRSRILLIMVALCRHFHLTFYHKLGAWRKTRFVLRHQASGLFIYLLNTAHAGYAHAAGGRLMSRNEGREKKSKKIWLWRIHLSGLYRLHTYHTDTPRYRFLWDTVNGLNINITCVWAICSI